VRATRKNVSGDEEDVALQMYLGGSLKLVLGRRILFKLSFDRFV
jgi:hypothetical protein